MEEPRSRPKRYGTWIFGMETELKYGCLDFGLELYGFVWISCLDICLWVAGFRKPNPRMNLCMENPFVSLGFCYERT